ncbi:methionine gamma-lyase family protein [bacterium]|nr:methionine gamma-lyase family protein [bacterium]
MSDWKRALSDLGIAADLADCGWEGLKATASLREEIRSRASINQWKVLKALQDVGLIEGHFFPTTGYGFTDMGREALDEAVAEIFKTEAGLMRLQIVSGTHALAAGLFGSLKPGDELLSITGLPYDTMQPVIGIGEVKRGSLAYWGVKYRQLDLLEDGGIDMARLPECLNERTAMVMLQRSRGYAWRPSLSLEAMGEAIKEVRRLAPQAKVMVDNCYGELVGLTELTELGADLVAGSLIKNLGGGIAPCGGYLAGKRECVEGAAEWLTAPGIGPEEGPTLGFNRSLAQGLFMAPIVVGAALEGAVWGAWVMEQQGLEVFPKWNDPRSDIIQAVRVGSPEAQQAFCLGIQKAGPVDHSACPTPWQQPGYDDPVIMAGGTFIQGSSIELSADCPVRPPYGCYMQGGVSFAHVQIGVLRALQELKAGGLLPH